MSKNLSDQELRAQMDEEARAAEAAAYDDSDDGAPLPDHVKLSRPNRARSKVMQVRLTPDEFEAIERIAEQRGLPPSAVARAQLLKLIAEGWSAVTPNLAGLAAELERVAEGLRALPTLVLAVSPPPE